MNYFEVFYYLKELLIIAVFFLVIAIVIGILYLLTLQNLLYKVSPQNRTAAPGDVWLLIIPFFNLIYAFILYPKISESVEKEYSTRGLAKQDDFGKSLGLLMPVLSLCAFVPVLGFLAGFANLIIWIIFWSKMVGYKSQLSGVNINQSNFSQNSNQQINIPDICPHCKNPNTKRIRLCEWCGSQIY